jgi:Na+-driven multidrug efflux pump
VAGTAVATLLSMVAGVLLMLVYFRPSTSYLRFDAGLWAPRLTLWQQLLKIGLPAGGEFALMAVYMGVIYAVARPFGAAAQAGFGIAGRIMQALFMPAVALGFAVAPVAGQNFGARLADRVRHTFTVGAGMAGGAMSIVSLVTFFGAALLMRPFSSDPAVIAVGEEYLRIFAVPMTFGGIVFVSSSMFQALGNSLPPLLTSFARTMAVIVPMLLLSGVPGFTLRWVWYLAAGSSVLHLTMNLLLLRREFARRLAFPAPTAPTVPA